MPDTPEITELVDVTAPRVDGVGSPANGIPFLLIKQVDPAEPVDKAADTKDCPTCGGKGTILEGNRDCPDCGKGDLPKGKVAKESSDDPAQPGSGPWEAADAAALRGAAATLAQVASALETAREREMAEVAAGATEDMGDAWDLSDALDALDYALGITARLSFGEAQEAAMGGHDDLVVAKAERADDGSLVTKAGKKISADTAKKLSAARDHMVAGAGHITDLLGDTDTDTTQEVEKMTKDELQEMVTKAVSDAVEAKLADITEVGKEAGELGTEPAATDAPAEGVEKGTGAEPTEPAEPTAEVVKAADLEELKTALPDLIKAAVEATVSPLEEQITKMANQPRPGGPLVNGAATNGTTTPGSPEEMRKALDGKTPAERAEILNAWSHRNVTALFSGDAS